MEDEVSFNWWFVNLVYYRLGRGSNTWSSPQGSLAVSFKCQLKDGIKLPFLQYIVSMALVQGVKSKPGLQVSEILGC